MYDKMFCITNDHVMKQSHRVSCLSVEKFKSYY